MKKNDFILIIVIVLLGASIYAGMRLFSRSGDTVTVTADNNVLYTLPLDEDTTVRIPFGNNEYNELVIKNGTAYISDASCPDRICVKHTAIKNDGETIVCLPHKLVVRVVKST